MIPESSWLWLWLGLVKVFGYAVRWWVCVVEDLGEGVRDGGKVIGLGLGENDLEVVFRSLRGCSRYMNNRYIIFHEV